jgi:hypothetical protein
MNASNISWECIQCGMPNISTSIFNNYSFVSPNPFDNLNNLGKTIHSGVLGPRFVSVSEELAISNRHRYNCTFLLGLYLRYLVTLHHIDCQNVHPHIYECMNASNISWECIQCGMPNISTSIFNNYSFVSPNPFDKLPFRSSRARICFSV